VITRSSVAQAGRAYGLWVHADGIAYVAVGGADGTPTAPGTVPVGQWAHVVGVVDAGARTTRIYVNGALVATGTCSTAIPAVPGVPLRIGAGDPGMSNITSFLGSIDEVVVYNRALSATEVATRAAR
jgi:hypothetical protein